MQAIAPQSVGGICLDQPAKWECVLWGRVVPFLVLIFIALNPFPHTTAIREACYYPAVALLMFYFYRYRDWRVLKTPLTLPVALFTGWAVIGLFWALDVGASAGDIRSHLLKYIGLFLLLTVFFNSRVKIRLLFWTIIVSVVISGFHDMYSFYVVGKNAFTTRMCIPYHELPVGPLGFMALFAAFLVVYLWKSSEGLWRKWALTVCMGGLFLILFVTQMRSLMIALLFALFALFWHNKKLLTAWILILIFCFLIFSSHIRSFEDKGSNAERLTINYMSLMMIKEHPITGIGFSMETPGNKDLIDHKSLLAQVPQNIKFEDANYNNPHNIWLGLVVRLGFVGFSLFIFIMIQGARMCLTGMQHDNHNLRFRGQLYLCLLVLFSVYGLFNEVFMHLLEALLCVLFAMIALLYRDTQGLMIRKSSNEEACP